MGKKLLVSVILIAFLAGSLVTGSIAFGEDGLTKLQKQCAKEPKSPEKIKPDCELLALINALELIPGPQGETGEQGEQGPTGVMNVYEVSDTTVIPGSTNAEVRGDTLQLRCLDGDWLYSEGIPFSMTAEPFADIVADDLLINTVNPTVAIKESPTRNISDTKLIGYDVTPNRNGGQQPNEVFDITVVVSILCLSPSP